MHSFHRSMLLTFFIYIFFLQKVTSLVANICLSFQLLVEKTLSLYTEYSYNTCSFAKKKIIAYHGFIATLIVYEAQWNKINFMYHFFILYIHYKTEHFNLMINNMQQVYCSRHIIVSRF